LEKANADHGAIEAAFDAMLGPVLDGPPSSTAKG
jgi:hypothetical protein